MHIAAELIGSVRQHPTITETVIPIRNGLRVVALFISSPIWSMKSLMGEQQYLAIRPPTTMVSIGVRMMSTGVFLEMRFPASAPIITAMYEPTGPPNL